MISWVTYWGISLEPGDSGFEVGDLLLQSKSSFCMGLSPVLCLLSLSPMVPVRLDLPDQASDLNEMGPAMPADLGFEVVDLLLQSKESSCIGLSPVLCLLSLSPMVPVRLDLPDQAGDLNEMGSATP